MGSIWLASLCKHIAERAIVIITHLRASIDLLSTSLLLYGIAGESLASAWRSCGVFRLAAAFAAGVVGFAASQRSHHLSHHHHRATTTPSLHTRRAEQHLNIAASKLAMFSTASR